MEGINRLDILYDDFSAVSNEVYWFISTVELTKMQETRHVFAPEADSQTEIWNLSHQQITKVTLTNPIFFKNLAGKYHGG